VSDPQTIVSGHEILLNIGGAVALLLWATRMVRTGILRAFGSRIRFWLGQSTKSRAKAFAMGLGVTGLLQSSTATALLLVSFVGRGLMAVGPALAVMLGADLGSTLVVQVLSFDISAVTPLLILAGVVAFMASSAMRRRQIGRILIGLGLMLLSLQLIVSASEPLRDSQTLRAVLDPLGADPILALALGAILAWLAHSSVATVLLVMSLTMTGVVPLELGVVLVLGANVGSGVIPFVLSLRGDPLARRVPTGNLLFRVLGALAALPFAGLAIPYLAMIDPEPARQIANAHTAFNVLLAAVFLPLTGVMESVIGRLLPVGESQGEAEERPRYLDDTAIDTPPVALACATREVMRLADIVEIMLRDTMNVFRDDDEKLLGEIAKRDDVVDRLHEAIKLYLTQVSRNALDDADSQRCVELITFTTNLEHIGDIIEKNLLELAQKKIRNRQQFSEEGWRELTRLHERVVRNMQLAMGVFVSKDVETSRQLIAEKEHLRDLEREASERHLERLREGKVESVETSALHLDILRDLKRINSHLTAVAYPIVDASGQLRSTRLKKMKKGAASGSPGEEPPLSREPGRGGSSAV
jgi:phosphate:Na+ symporter